MAELFRTTLINDANLKGYFRLEGNVNDASSVANNGSTGGSPSYVAGKYGSGLELVRASNQYIDFPYNAAYDFGTGNFSAGGWYKKTAGGSATFSGLLTTRVADTNGWQIVRGSSDDWTFGCGAGGVFDSTSGYTITDSAWHLVVAVRTTELQLWVDGIKVATGTNNSRNVNTGFLIRSGQYRYNETTNGLDASVDEFFLFNRALTESEILTLYRDGIFAHLGFEI